MSLLAPFGFGQKHAYFHVEVTIHELTNVPLVAGLFACKWKIKGAHSLSSLQHSAAAAAHQTSSRALGNTSRRQRDSSGKDAAKGVHATDHHSGSSNNLALGAPHAHPSSHRGSPLHNGDTASIASGSSKDSSRHGLHKPAFLTSILHPKGHEKSDQDTRSHSPHSPGHAAQSSSNLSPAPQEADAGSSDSNLRKDSFHSRLSSASHTKSPADAGHSKTPDTHDHDVDPLLFFNQEPKGETEFIEVAEHRVEWEREVKVGMRVGIGKPKASGPLDTSASDSRDGTPAVSTKSSAKDLRSRVHRDQHLDDMSTAWGRLTSSEMKLTIKQEMPANAKATTHSPVFGHVIVDLSEFAPDPPILSSSGRHHHHHHHHHHHRHQSQHPHHHHHHHHQHGPGGEHSYRDRTCRTETRKFLLNESRTNATVKLTITVTFLGGVREYYVPPISNGLMVNGLGSLVAPTLLEAGRDSISIAGGSDPSPQHSCSSANSSLRNEPIRAGASTRNQLVGCGLPSASSLSITQMNPSSRSTHNLFGPPLKSVYNQKTWNSRVPTENLVAAASGTVATKKKPHRTAEAALFSTRDQAESAPDDIINAIFKGIPVGGSHNGQLNDEARAAKDAAARARRAERAAARAELQARRLERRAGESPEQTLHRRIRTVSTASNVSRKSERSFSFGLYRSKDKDKDKSKNKKTAKEHNKSSSSAEVESLSSDKGQGTHLSVPGPGPGKLTPAVLVESPSASTEALPRSNRDAATASAPAPPRTKRLASVRWDLDGDDAAHGLVSSSDTTPIAEHTSKEGSDRAAMPPPPSVVVDHPYVPILAGGITAASSSALNLTQSTPPPSDAAKAPGADTRGAQDSANALLSPNSQQGTTIPSSTANGDAASLCSSSSTTSTQGGEKKKISSNDLKDLYQAGLPIPQSLSTSTSVGLDRLKHTSRALDQFAKESTKTSRASLSRPDSGSGAGRGDNDSHERKPSKGNRGIEPSEAASKGWHGAGWLRPISTAPAPLPPCSPEVSSPESEEFEEAEAFDASDLHRFGSFGSQNSDDQRSSATDQTAVSEASASASDKFRPEHKREGSFTSVYYDVDDGSNSWPEEQVKLSS